MQRKCGHFHQPTLSPVSAPVSFPFAGVHCLSHTHAGALELVVVFTSHHSGSSSIYWQFVTDIINACSQ